MAITEAAPATRRGMPTAGVIGVTLVVLALILGIVVAITVPVEHQFSVGVSSFDTPPFLSAVPWFTRAMLLGLVAFALAITFWLAMSRNHELVPSKRQFFGEWAYSFVRDGIARDQIGKDFLKYLPYLIALITFVIINNLWGMFPFTLLPTMSHVGWAYSLAVISWLIYNVVGIRKHGFFGYIKHQVLPAGVPPALWVLVIPIEFISNILIRPVTLSLRLFGNMFSGHLLLLVFAGGGQFLLFETAPLINKVAGGFALIFSLAILALEVFVQCVQAYIMTILSAQYIGSALADEH